MTAWTDHCKNYSNENGCTYKEAMTRGKSSYSPTTTGGKIKIKNVLRKVRNSTKKGSQLFNEHGHLVGELDKTGKISTKLQKLNNTVGKINDTIDTIDGGKFNFKKAARKVKHTASKISKGIDKYAPLVEMVAPEFAPEIESIRMANSAVKKIKGGGKKNPYILNGGSFKLHGGSVGYTQSSMISPHHPSFNPQPPKSIRKRQTEN
jgi:archaellum component FlaC